MSGTLDPALIPNAASVALIDGDRVLLIKRAYAPYQHLWTLPGGRTEADESGEACACRELTEELGLTIADLVHLETQVLAKGQWRLAVYATRRFAGTPTPSDEIADLRWVRLGEVAELKTTSRLVDVLEMAFAAIAR